MTRTTIAGAVLLLAGLAACQNTAEPVRMVSPASPSFVVNGGSCTLANGNTASTGFDEFGYNRCAHNFVGTFEGYCAQRHQSPDCGGTSGDTRLNMKWNEEWDRGNATGWTAGPYDAWLNNEIKGTDLSGADFSEHFKTKWDSSCAAGSAVGVDGGLCIWGSFEIIMDQGTEDGVHVWWTKLSPAGFGN